jgi:hypothetical protein
LYSDLVLAVRWEKGWFQRCLVVVVVNFVRAFGVDFFSLKRFDRKGETIDYWADDSIVAAAAAAAVVVT